MLVKYKPAYAVTVSGELLGFIEDKKFVDNKIDKYMNDTTGSVAFREIAAMPEYNYKLVSREKELEDAKIVSTIEKSAITTYRLYAVTIDGEQKAIVENQEKAEEIVNEVKKDLNSEIDLKLGITEIYTQECNLSDKEQVLTELNSIKVAKVDEYNKAQEEKAKAEARKKALATTAKVAATGNISGMPLSIPVRGTISSRFGSRGASRSSTHTGLDISAPMGTGISPISAGTVTYAGYKGSYGNLVVISHGNGIESYYAHCTELYVSVGQNVGSDTTIASVGSTGNSTGPHLHLEIRINGTPVNPQNYLY